MSLLSRRQFLTAAAGAALSLPAHAFPFRQPQNKRRPNIILFIADDMRYDAFRLGGNPLVYTPNVDRLASEGHNFSNFFVTTSICPTSRASIFLGEYASRHGIWNFVKPFSKSQLNRIYPVLLRNAGYYTGFIGKWGVGGISRVPHLFDVWGGYSGQNEYYDKEHPKQSITERQDLQGRDFLSKVPRDKPFLLVVCYKAPHGPLTPTKRFDAYYDRITFPRANTDTPHHAAKLPPLLLASRGRDQYMQHYKDEGEFQGAQRAYYELISDLDDAVGNTLAVLKERGMEDNTWILFTSDNGMMLGEHQIIGKRCMYEESIRVPLIIRSPQPQPAMVSHPQIALNIDIAPTILDIAKVAQPFPIMQGRSLLPLVMGNPTPWRQVMYYEYMDDIAEYQDDGTKIILSMGIRGNRWKYTTYEWRETREELLFDLFIDPDEENNLAFDPAYQLALERWRNKTLLVAKGMKPKIRHKSVKHA